MEPRKYGYARVSTTDQSLDIQKTALRDFGCDMVIGEQMSGTSMTDRRELRSILNFIRQGDSLVVTRLDRLARNMGDLQDIVRELRSKGAKLVITEQNIDTGTAMGKAFLDMLGVFAEFETSLRAERQREGVERAKANGVYKTMGDRRRGHFKVKPDVIKAAVDRLGDKRAAARELGISKDTVYRALDFLSGGNEAAAG